MPRGINTIENIFSKTIRDEESGCLLYMGYLDKDGYARISCQGKNRIGSDAVYEMVYGPIPEGYEVDHICHVRHCVEPTHLRLLTHRQNVIHIKTYVEKRHQRLRTFLDAYPQAEFFPVLITSTRLKELWECGRNKNVGRLLLTMSRAFSEEFFYERFKAGRGRSPDLYAIGIQPRLIDKLSHEDEQRETLTEDSVILSRKGFLQTLNPTQHELDLNYLKQGSLGTTQD